jgi:hypothetical protein
MKYLLTTKGCCTAMLAALSLGAEAADGSSAPASSITCADPAVDIEMALISKTGPTTGRVRITGVVKNLGTATWIATSPTHRLQMVLAQKDSEANPLGNPVQPPIAIAQLSPGQQFRIDHQMNWDTSKNTSYPRFIVKFSDSGKIGAYPARYQPDCRTDNNRKEVTAADINKLFGPAAPSGKPLTVQSYRLLGGVGVNTVEVLLGYNKTSAAAGKITASVAAPYRGTSSEVPIQGNSGSARIRVHIPCDIQNDSTVPLRPVDVTYRLWGSLGLPGNSRWVVSYSTEHSIPYRELCGAAPPNRPSRSSSR